MHNSTKYVSNSWLLLWLATITIFGGYLAGFNIADAHKYMIIASDMWQHHSYWLPHYQGHAYSDKPPLMFWLFISGWQVFGFNQWWPQLVMFSFATGSLFMTGALAKQLWPNRAEIKIYAPYLLLGLYNFLLFSKQIRVDVPLLFFSLCSMYALLCAWQGSKRAWWGYSLALAASLMFKGPVIFVYTLLPSLLLPFIMQTKSINKSSWYLRLFMHSLLGIAGVGLWVIPAAIQGGQQYASEILWGQVAHRATQNRHGFFFYLSNLPMWLLPWIIFAPVWRGALCQRETVKNNLALSWCYLTIMTGVVTFSLFGQKAGHYIFPLYPLFAVLITYYLSQAFKQKNGVLKTDAIPLVILLLATGFLLWFFPAISHWLPERTQLKFFDIYEVRFYTVVTAFSLAFALCFTHKLSYWGQVIFITIATAIMCMVMFFSFKFTMNKPYKTDNQLISSLQHKVKNNKPIAIFGKNIPIQIQQLMPANSKLLANINAANHWLQQNPTGILISNNNQFVLQQRHLGKQPLSWYYQKSHKVIALWQG